MNLLEHLNMFNQLLDKLYKVNVKVEEEYETILLFTLLPNSYDNLVTTLLFGKDIVSIEDVMTLLLSNETRRPNLEEGQDYELVGLVENYKGKLSVWDIGIVDPDTGHEERVRCNVFIVRNMTTLRGTA